MVKKSTSIKISTSILILIILLLILDFVPEMKLKDSTFNYNQYQRPLIIAHGGSKLLYPENTLLAFDSSLALGAEVLEMDVRLTRDSQLVCIHDETLDRTSNGKGEVVRYSLLVLKQLNFAKKFQNLEGINPYRDTVIKVPSLEQVFVRYPYVKLIIELKDNGENGRKAARHLAYLLKKYKREKDVIISSFHQSTLDYLQTITHNQYLCSAAMDEVKNFVIKEKLFLSKFHIPQTHSLALPLQSSGFDLAKPSFIHKAFQKGYSVFFWTINDKNEMCDLIEKKVDGIITDRPDLLIQVLQEKGLYP